ncbi:LysR family transcriptional regulator [Paraburkholderia sp. ZP32-5]|uniref:LysR family transcriptional regulator n=1 Tax=Paraburkholderia sp. ZP32-5 TaxID=2883245 RepID=UPI001F3730C3|nr:LysR family transcriptional regulator [Paraburkholderia sp. ZP32-5]
MTVEHLQGLAAFVRSVEAGSFTGGARLLGTTPSAVSKSIARLERRLGVRLFQRTTRAFSLSIGGQAYYERVAPLVKGIAEADEVLAAPATATGRLRVSLPGDLGHTLLESIASTFLARHPDLALDVNIGDRHVDLIREGFDLVLRVGEASDSGLYSRSLASLRLVLVASPKYLKTYGEPHTIKDLTTHRHVRYRLGGQIFPITFHNGQTLFPQGMFDTDNGEAMRTAAVNGLGIAQLLGTTVHADVAARRLKVLMRDVPLRSVPLQFLHAFGRNVPNRAALFMDFVSEQIESLPWKGNPNS